MSLKEHMAKLTTGLDQLDEAAPAGATGSPGAPVRRSSGSIPATSTLMHFNADVRAIVAESKHLKAEVGKARVVPLALIDDSPYQLAALEEARVAALVENLRENPLSSPISVRLKADGRFETIAGHHRREAYRRLDRTEIEATVREATDDQASDLVFFDNLLAPNLSDYDRYLGFRKIKQRGMTLEQVAKASGVNAKSVFRYLQFDALPEAARDLVAIAKNRVGVSLAAELAPLTKQHGDRVTEAVRMVTEDGKTVRAAVAWLVQEGAQNAAARRDPKKFWQGKKLFAELTRREAKVTLSFANATTAEAFEAELADWLKAKAADPKA